MGTERGGGGDDGDDGGGFVRRAYLWAFGLGLLFYVSIGAVVVHDMRVTEPSLYWGGESFARHGLLALLFAAVLFFPSIALFLLSRWFASRDD